MKKKLKMFKKAAKAIEKHESFLVITHVKPDGDALGSQLAIMEALQSLKKRVVGITDQIPEMYRMMDGIDGLIPSEKYSPDLNLDACIALEISSPSRWFDGKFPVHLPVINIDHHPDNTFYGSINIIEPSAAAVALPVYRLIKKMGIKITASMADNLYIAIMTDTGHFGYSNTSAEAMITAAELIELGASPARLTDMIYKNYSIRRMRIHIAAISTLKDHLNGKIITITLNRKTVRNMGIEMHETDGIIDFAQRVGGQEAALFFKEFTPDQVRVSLRSKGRLNVQQIAAKYGGGGHIFASGCTIDGKLEDVRQQLLSECEHQLKQLGQEV